MSIAAAAAAAAADSPMPADQPAVRVIRISDPLPFGQEPIDYFATPIRDSISRLQDALDRGDSKLAPTDRHGYLLSVLQLLQVPVESQLLVFSKTARNPDLVSPRTPRAIYFNDEVSVAWIPQARELELTAIDVTKGATFYTLSQPLLGEATAGGESPVKASRSPRFNRNNQCLSCHAGRSSLDVPGLLVRAFQTDGSGKPLQGYSQVTHELEYSKRWGGWFVTGTPAGFAHRANLIRTEENERAKQEPELRSSVGSLDSLCAIDRYLVGHSDVAAHLVFNHQMHGLNLLIRVGMEARLVRRSDAEEQLLRYLVFADEPELPVALEPAARRSGYARWFETQSKTDSRGRSLRQLDLETRVFRYRLSYLVAHPLFNSLPNDCRQRLVTKLVAGLSLAEPPEMFRHIPLEERLAALEIARATVPAFAVAQPQP